VPILTAATDLQGFTWLLSYGQQGGQLPGGRKGTVGGADLFFLVIILFVTWCRERPGLEDY